MKRFFLCVAFAFLSSMIAGCGGGLEEGMPKDASKEAVPAELKAEVAKNREKMIMKKPARPPAQK
jgi:hypothetical protein